jgi:hypothetical protein
MSAISTTGARIVRLDNVRPAHRRHLRLIEAFKLERSLQYRCSEVSIMFISRPLDVLHSCALQRLLFANIAPAALDIASPQARAALGSAVIAVDVPVNGAFSALRKCTRYVPGAPS